MPYIVSGWLLMIALALFVGVLMVLKRLWTKDLGPREKIQDSEHLASEIHDEILRLEELRNRLDPSYAMLGHDISASPVESKLKSAQPADEEETEGGEPKIAEGGTAEGEATGAPSQDVIDAAVAEATKHLNDEIASLNSKLSEAGDTSPNDEAASAAATAENEEEMKKLSAQVTDLSEKLEDYRAFEDEIALVKSYKEEIDKLKGQIVEMEGSHPAITDDDITSLFEEMGKDDSAPAEAAAPAAPEPAEEPAPAADEESVEDMLADAFGDAAAAPAEETTVAADAPASTEADKVVFEGDAAPAKEEVQVFAADEKTEQEEAQVVAADEKPAEKEAAGDATGDDFSLDEVTEGNAEAIAELGEEGDELMAEFEKALSPEKEETT